jgi:hypothetical protein
MHLLGGDLPGWSHALRKQSVGRIRKKKEETKT